MWSGTIASGTSPAGGLLDGGLRFWRDWVETSSSNGRGDVDTKKPHTNNEIKEDNSMVSNIWV